MTHVVNRLVNSRAIQIAWAMTTLQFRFRITEKMWAMQIKRSEWKRNAIQSFFSTLNTMNARLHLFTLDSYVTLVTSVILVRFWAGFSSSFHLPISFCTHFLSLSFYRSFVYLLTFNTWTSNNEQKKLDIGWTNTIPRNLNFGTSNKKKIVRTSVTLITCNVCIISVHRTENTTWLV